jgi:hypothetical protein
MVARDGWEGLWPLVYVGVFSLFFSLVNKQEAAGSRFNSILLSILFFQGHGYGLEVGRWIRGESHVGTPWPNPWREFALATIAPTSLYLFLFFAGRTM